MTEPIDMSVYFCPRDNCSSHLAEAIGMAQNRVHCAFYDLDLENVKTALIEQGKKTDVLLLLDNDNIDKLGKLSKQYWIRQDVSQKLMHNKFCVIDDDYVWTGSFNPTHRGDEVNNNNALLIKSRYLNQNYEAEFKEMWYGTFNSGKNVAFPRIGNVENYFCPEDDCAAHVIDAINAAKSTIKFMTFSFTDDDIGNALIAKHKQGINVQGVFETTQNNNYLEYPRLAEAGIEVKWDRNPANMHHKVFIIDNSTVVTGSYNPTGNGNKNNDENVLIIHDEKIAQEYLEEFKLVFG